MEKRTIYAYLLMRVLGSMALMEDMDMLDII